MEKPQVTLAKTILVITIASGCCDAAQAEERDFELTPFGGYRFGGTVEIDGSEGSYKLDDAASIGLLLNWRHGSNTQWELLYAQQSTDAKLRGASGFVPAVKTDMKSLELGGTYRGSNEAAIPYLAVTLGGTHIRTDANGSESDTFFSASIGGGLQLFPTSQFGMRLEARARAILINSNTQLFCRTGPDISVCAIQVAGDTLSQVEAFAGFVFRF